MIATTVLILFLYFGIGGSAGPFGQMAQNVEDPIKEVITDDTRRDNALDALDKLQDDVVNFNKSVLNDAETMNKLVGDYDSKPADFDKFTSSFFAKHKKELAVMWQHRSEMLKQIKADEWETIITKAETEAKSGK